MSVEKARHRRFVTTWDDAVAWLANLVLRLASREYRDFVAGSVEYGMRSAVRDLDQGRTPPPDWRPGRLTR